MRFILFTLCNAHTHIHFHWCAILITDEIQAQRIQCNALQYHWTVTSIWFDVLQSSLWIQVSNLMDIFFLYIYWYIIEIQMDHIFLASILYFILIGYVFNFFFRDNSLLGCMIVCKEIFFQPGAHHLKISEILQDLSNLETIC